MLVKVTCFAIATLYLHFTDTEISGNVFSDTEQCQFLQLLFFCFMCNFFG